MNLWEEVLCRLNARVPRHAFYTWFVPTTLMCQNETSITVRVPNELFVTWLNRHYRGLIRDALSELGRPDVSVNLISDTPAEDPSPAARLPANQVAGPAAPRPTRAITFAQDAPDNDEWIVTEPMNIWDQIRMGVMTKISRLAFYGSFYQTMFASMDDRSITVRVPDTLSATRLSEQYSEVIRETLTELGHGELRVTCLVERTKGAA